MEQNDQDPKSSVLKSKIAKEISAVLSGFLAETAKPPLTDASFSDELKEQLSNNNIGIPASDMPLGEVSLAEMLGKLGALERENETLRLAIKTLTEAVKVMNSQIAALASVDSRIHYGLLETRFFTNEQIVTMNAEVLSLINTLPADQLEKFKKIYPEVLKHTENEFIDEGSNDVDEIRKILKLKGDLEDLAQPRAPGNTTTPSNT